MSGFLIFKPMIEDLAREYGSILLNRTLFARVLSEMVIGLAGYQEEGERIVPLIFFTTDLRLLLVSVKGNDCIKIGEGIAPKNFLGHPEDLRALESKSGMGNLCSSGSEPSGIWSISNRSVSLA